MSMKNHNPEEHDASGGELFIVDNSVSGWTVLRYLQEWCELAKSFDIATGFFEIGSLLALDTKWQLLEKIRILMGSETTHRTRALFLEAVRARALEALDSSIEAVKEGNPFLTGVDAIRAALESKKIECRIYDKGKFHAKTYITHATREVVGAKALVGSSNFTKPGLTENIELNVQIQSGRDVAQLQEWFEEHWRDGVEFTADVMHIVERQLTEYRPSDVYARALQEYFRGHELTADEWDIMQSRMFRSLDLYQKEAYRGLMKIAHRHGGAFLCDGVGLGKTFVGLMLIERFVLHEGKNVVLFATKAAKESVWEPHIRQWLPHIGSRDFSNLAVFSHTDLTRSGDFPERFHRIAERADVVIIDEAHHFRNLGTVGNPEKGKKPSRYHSLFDLLDPEKKKKTAFMLTATPINNNLSDFRHMIELFTRRHEDVFAGSLGVNNLRAHFVAMEAELRRRIEQATVKADDDDDALNVEDYTDDASDVLETDPVFRNLVIQRSRAYARESQLRETGHAAVFPERGKPTVADYSIRKSYAQLLDLFTSAFAKENPLFTLPMYYPLHWYKGSDSGIDAAEENRQKQVVGLIRTNFLKRFESSVAAFELSCDRLLRKLLAFVEKHSETAPERRQLERWKDQSAEIIGYARDRQLEIWGEENEDDEEEDIILTCPP